MNRNFGFQKEQDIDMEKKVEFWTGFIAGGIAASVSLVVIILIAVWKYPA